MLLWTSWLCKQRSSWVLTRLWDTWATQLGYSRPAQPFTSVAKQRWGCIELDFSGASWSALIAIIARCHDSSVKTEPPGTALASLSCKPVVNGSRTLQVAELQVEEWIPERMAQLEGKADTKERNELLSHQRSMQKLKEGSLSQEERFDLDKSMRILSSKLVRQSPVLCCTLNSCGSSAFRDTCFPQVKALSFLTLPSSSLETSCSNLYAARSSSSAHSTLQH